MPAYSPERRLTALQTTIKVEPLGAYLDICHWAVGTLDAALDILGQPATTAIVAVRIERPPRRIPLFGGLHGFGTCTSLIKYALGIQAWWIWTPKALCDYLLSNLGGTILTKEVTNGCDPGRQAES